MVARGSRASLASGFNGIRFTERFWIHLALLHAGLAVRIAGDLAGVYELRAWGALLNLLAILLFLVQTVTSLERR